MFGPVSLSNSYPQIAKDFIVYFYSLYFSDNEPLARSFTPYQGAILSIVNYAQNYFVVITYEEDFKVLKSQLNHLDASVPTLFKQYSELLRSRRC